jgi:hypothetical protein
MNKRLYLEAALCCKQVYEINSDLGTTEFDITKHVINGKGFQILAIAGTNEPKDWLKNFNLTSRAGIKTAAYKAAYEIVNNKTFIRIRSRSPHLPLIVTGHSKAGATAIAFMKLFYKNHFPQTEPSYCIAFAPARCLRYWTDRRMDNTTIFTDPDDPVSFVGRVSFGHPICEHIKNENNYFGFKIGDHKIDNWVRFTKNMLINP